MTDEAVTKHARDRASEGQPLPGSVLVVDDDDAYRRIAALRLSAGGVACRVAGTHEEALCLLRKHGDIDVVVVDYHMRGDDPAKLVHCIRAERPDVAIVGHSSMERRGHFAALGVDRFLLKPWTPEQLMALLRHDPAQSDKRGSRAS